MSIVVPSRSSAQTLARVLSALAGETAAHASELLLLLDQPTAAVRDVAASAEARVLESPDRLGLSGQIERARKVARSRRLVLLHDDAVPEPGWLEALLAAARAAPDVAILGSLQLDSAGAPLRGASLVWPEGFTTAAPIDGIGRTTATVLEADYVGTASMLVDLEALSAVGGADERFHPAYYVDVDLCFAVRARGGRVALAPGSRVVHHESRSSTSLFKEFLQLRNRQLFVEKWRERLGRRPAYRPDDTAREALLARVAEERREGRSGAVPLPPTERPTMERRERNLALLRSYVEWLEARRPENGDVTLDDELARARSTLASE